MKYILTLLTLAFTSVSIASSASYLTPSREVMQITRALVNNPDIVAQLQKNNSSNLAEYKITALKHGVYQYELIFKRVCECIPSTATVTIVEDMTPTYADGAIVYKSSINIKSGF